MTARAVGATVTDVDGVRRARAGWAVLSLLLVAGAGVAAGSVLWEWVDDGRPGWVTLGVRALVVAGGWLAGLVAWSRRPVLPR